MDNGYWILLVFLFLGAFIAAAAIATGKLLGFSSKAGGAKFKAYECGMETFGNARVQFKVGYVIFALIFLVFDVEALFLFPIAVHWNSIVDGSLGIPLWVAMVDLGFFFGVLLFGLAYSWKKGWLKWE
ncbi:MAG: NADH-quinone oxidoreductase subunit A [Fibromonadaceae bacterium]|jgi:NADH-quinone oxidoreductase subunit A|nr:NADH-quinone oxidoreductase subunit A [Fibromonadaceae bacterium]